MRDFLFAHGEKERNARRAGVLAFAGLVFIGTLSCLYFRRVEISEPQNRGVLGSSIAQLQEVQGRIQLRRRNEAGWQSGAQGVQLWEGDMIQTSGSGTARLKFTNGASVLVPPETMFSIRGNVAGSGRESMPLSSGSISIASGTASADRAHISGISKIYASVALQPGGSDPAPRPQELQPTLELKKIVPFGRSLELIGRVDPGSRLMINGEAAEVAADGSYKHFTKPFPTSLRRVRLVLKAIDLAGRVRSMTVSADLGSGSGYR